MRQGDLRDDAARVCQSSCRAASPFGSPMTQFLHVPQVQGATSLISHCNEDAAVFVSSHGEVLKLWAGFKFTLCLCFGSSRHCGWNTSQDHLGRLLAFC